MASIELDEIGGAVALDDAGEVVAYAPTPWALDSTGKSVPTHFEVEGTTLHQVVEHKAGNYTYGIVADPSWIFYAKCAAAVGLFLVKNFNVPSKLVKTLKDTVGFVKLLKKQGSKKNAILYLAARISGAKDLDDLVSNCWPG